MNRSFFFRRVGPRGRGFGGFPYSLSGAVAGLIPGIKKGTAMVLGYLFMVSQPNLSPLEQI